MADKKELKEPPPPRRTVLDAFKKTSGVVNPAEIGFGTGARPSLTAGAGGGPGPGAYPIKSTLGKVFESNLNNPLKFSLRGRTKFGDPNEKTMNKTAAAEPGPGQYNLYGKFLGGETPRVTAFPKGAIPKEKSFLGPGPGSYKVLESMGKQVLSSKPGAVVPGFSKEKRKGMANTSSEVGPGDYLPGPAACEPQVLSSRPTCATIKFGTGYRKGKGLVKRDLSEPAPGPGSYSLPGGVATKTRGSPYRDSPAATMSGRNKFGSPW